MGADLGSWIRHPFLERGQLPLFVAHRGGALEWPECTAVAFEGALGLGAEVLELDVHYTRDRHIVVLHDDELGRTTSGSGRVSALTVGELQALDAGYRYCAPDGTFAWRGCGLQVLTLDSLLERFPHARLNIDIKDRDEELAHEVVTRLREAGRAERTCLASFHESICWYLWKNARDFCLAVSPFGTLGLALSAGHGLRPGDIPGHVLEVPIRFAGLPIIDAERVAGYHRAGYAVHVWTVDDAATMRWLIELGVDGIMTDRPSVLRAVLAEHGARFADTPTAVTRSHVPVAMTAG